MPGLRAMSRAPKCRLYFVRAQQLGFPYATKRVTGYFETPADAAKRLSKIRGDWPQHNLTIRNGHFDASAMAELEPTE
ncbi:MAG: hypothetical protein ACREBK_07650 [Sphingomicrobium sp.]